MARYDLFFQKFNEKVPLTEEEQEQIRAYLSPKKLRKRQFLLQEGDICKAIAFVEKGALREYSVDNGSDHIHAQQELSSREVIREFIAQIKQRYNLQKVYLGGFSQGAIMS